MLLEGRRIGLIEDDPVMGESLVQCLSLEGAKVKWWRTGGDAVRDFAAARADIAICDIRLPDMRGDDIFKSLARTGNVPPFMFMTAYSDIEHAVSLIRAGACDYVTKPFDLDEFVARLSALLRSKGTTDEGILGASPLMRDIEAKLVRLAERPTTVLFQGESGVGKEVCARFLHQPLAEQGHPFMAVNCAAIPADLMESELFGHEKGAFTGAAQAHAGYAERAGKGTLFLDEVGDLAMPLQAKLLRLIEERKFHRIGGERPIDFTARIVCASNIDLADLVSEGRFRADLFYRINVVTLEIPPLRKRHEDIVLLLNRFFAEQCEWQSSSLRTMSTLVEDLALSHDWPGNVRELRNRVERAVALADGDTLMPCDLFPELDSCEDAADPIASLAEVRASAEKRQIERTLRQAGGQIVETARLLGVSRTTLWEKMRRYGLGE